MDLTLSWDLFIIVFFSVVIAYSFIVGKNQTLKIIIATYVAILVSDGVSNLFLKYVNPRFLNVFFPGYDAASIMVVVKLVLFIGAIVTLVIKGAFKISLPNNDRGFRFIVLTTIFGVLSGGLIVSTILYFTAGGTFVQPVAVPPGSPLATIQQSSLFVRNMVVHYDIWFSLPAIGFLLISFFDGGSESIAYEE